MTALVQAFLTALRLLTRLPVEVRDSADNRRVLTLFPVVGVGLGVLAWCIAAFLYFSTNPFAAGFLCAVILPLFLWWLTEGRNLKGIIWAASRWALVDSGDEENNQYRPYWVLLAVQTAFISRIVGTGIIVYSGHAAWLLVPSALALSAHAELLAGAALAPEAQARWPLHWLVGGAIAVVVAGCMHALLAGLAVLIVAWGVTHFLGRVLATRCGGPVDASSGAVREAVEIVALLVGIIHFSTVY